MKATTIAGLGTSAPLERGAFDPECQLVARGVKTVLGEGAACDLDRIVNFYVALKSKPLMILAGPECTGKSRLVSGMAGVLTGGESAQFQKVSGHAWWAARSGNLSKFTRMQARFIYAKASALLYEACHPDNLNRLFILSINHISPAELDVFFADLARQLQKGELHHLFSVDLSIPFPFPPNLHVIGTMDTSLFNWFDNAALLSKATVIHWRAGESTGAGRSPARTPPLMDTRSMSAPRILRATQAQRKLREFPAWREQTRPILIQLLGWLLKHSARLPTRAVMDETSIYLANAFSQEGAGLFAPEASQNLKIALDFSLAQILLPRIWKEMARSSMVRDVLIDQLGEGFPQTRWMVEQCAAGSI